MAARLRIVFGVLAVVTCLFGLAPLGVTAQSVAQTYSAASSLQAGQMVQLVPNTTNKVEVLTQSNISKTFGVVINPAESILSLSQSINGPQVYVADSGSYPVLVDNQNGPVHAGDYVAVSSVAGIGADSLTTDSTVLGKATSNFLGTNDSIGQVTLRLANGHQTTLQIGVVTVSIDVTGNPGNRNDLLPAFVQQFGQNFTTRPVSVIRSYLSLLILLASLIIAGSILYAGIRSSITAVGRNPLSRNPVMRSLIQVTLTSFIVVIIGVFAVYLLLRY
jgi:citrate lyase gamma subunit